MTIRILVLLMVTTAQAATQVINTALPVIDMHVHAGSTLGAVADSTRTATIARLKQHQVTLAAYIAYRPEILRTQSPDIDLLPSFNMTRIVSRDSLPNLAWLRAEITAGRIGLLGELSDQYYNIRPDDPALDPYFALAEELDVPVGIHLGFAPRGEAYRRPFRLTAGNPYFLEDVLVRHPRLRIYVMHAAYPYMQEMIGLMLLYPQVYVDISAINAPEALPRRAFYDYLERLVNAGLHERIMFGSDVTSQLRETIAAITEAPFLTSEQKRDILYNNAARFLRLSSEVISRHHAIVTSRGK